MNTDKHFIYYADELIFFERKAKQGNANNIRIKVRSDGRVWVSASTSISDALLLEALNKKSRWIYKQLCKFRHQQLHITPRKYVSGESHYYLGRQYMLKVVEDKNAIPAVKLFRGRLEVTTRKKSAQVVQTLLQAWYREKAKEIFGKRLAAMLEQALWMKNLPPLKISAMKTQWGSCSSQGALNLNLHLIKAPRDCIDYVILHELCHVVEHNHSKRFYRLMTQVMPDWEGIKEKLDSRAALILPERYHSP